ncbi:MAG: hypothetical protein Q8N88_06080 [Nanoarchaeota archaeon]|nr:hypothetical protein [Nanoarchaeota archaeon]
MIKSTRNQFEETKLKISMANKGRRHSEEFRKMRSVMMFGKTQSEETIKKRTESLKKYWSNPILREKSIQKMKKSLLNNPEKEQERRRKIKEKYADPEFRKRISEIKKGKRHSIKTEFKNGIIPWNKGKKGIMPIPWNKGKNIGHSWNKGMTGLSFHTPESKLKIKIARSKQIFPKKDSIPEVKIQNFLKQLNIEFITHKYIGEIEHSYQCDILIPDLNLIIEVDGDYWHGNKNNPHYQKLNSYQLKRIELDKTRTNELIEKGYRVFNIDKVTYASNIDLNELFKKRSIRLY